MSLEDMYKAAFAILTALGGGAVIVLGFSGWLGKIWAGRLMAEQTAGHNRALADLEADLRERADRRSQAYRLKIELYREASEPVIKLLIRMEHNEGVRKIDLQEFEKERLTTTALLAMFAPQSAFDAYNNMIDYIFDSFEGKSEYTFARFRELALAFFTEVRRDVGLYDDAISYKGNR